MPDAIEHPVTPDGRYFVVRGRLWRMSDPRLSTEQRVSLVSALMRARRAVTQARKARDAEAEARAHQHVDTAKIALGERGPVGWNDGAPDFNRHLARNTPYAVWFIEISERRGSTAAPTGRHDTTTPPAP